MPGITSPSSPASAADRHPTPLNPSIKCPRCGYDLRGAIQSWTDACPMQGVCTECGLDFQWSWMFRAQLHPWLFEHQWRKRPIRSAILTTLLSMRSGRLCREAILIHPIRLAPLAALLVLLVVAAAALHASGVAYAEYLFFSRYGRTGWGGGTAYEIRIALSETGRFLAVYLLPVLLIPPLAFVLIPTSLQQVKVRPAHIARIWLYSCIGVTGATLFITAAQLVWSLVTGFDAPTWLHPLEWQFIPWSPGMPWWTYVVKSTLLPIWAAAMLWVSLWWWNACRRYLHLPDATLTASLLMTIVLLASYLVQHVISVVQQLL